MLTIGQYVINWKKSAGQFPSIMIVKSALQWL